MLLSSLPVIHHPCLTNFDQLDMGQPSTLSTGVNSYEELDRFAWVRHDCFLRRRGMRGISDRSPRCSVPFFTQVETFEKLWPLIHGHLDDVMDRGKYSHGRKVAEFEAALAEWTGARYVVGVNSGTDALVLLLRSAGLRPGEEVI